MTFNQEAEWRNLFTHAPPQVTEGVVQVPDHKGGHEESYTPDHQVRHGLFRGMLRARREAVFDQVDDPRNREELDRTESDLMVHRVRRDDANQR